MQTFPSCCYFELWISAVISSSRLIRELTDSHCYLLTMQNEPMTWNSAYEKHSRCICLHLFIAGCQTKRHIMRHLFKLCNQQISLKLIIVNWQFNSSMDANSSIHFHKSSSWSQNAHRIWIYRYYIHMCYVVGNEYLTVNQTRCFSSVWRSNSLFPSPISTPSWRKMLEFKTLMFGYRLSQQEVRNFLKPHSTW